MTTGEFLEQVLAESIARVGEGYSVSSDLPEELSRFLDEILNRSESAKGVLTVVVTSATYKFFNPGQDIRNHQTSIPGGYSGRTFDAGNITPFLKKNRFPAMAESGWLTRSLEQKVPYDNQYTGAIQPVLLKNAFLGTLAALELGADCREVLSHLFQGLVIQRNRQEVDLAKPVSLPIKTIVALLVEHFSSKYQSEGAARLPVLAMYAIYQCLLEDSKRYGGKHLAPIESHTSADLRSGRIGDVEVSNPGGGPFEAVEVKHGIPLSAQLLRDAFEKFSKTQVDRYYLLSTKEAVSESERANIDAEIERIRNVHGCQVIANGLIKTLNYYLRLVTSPAQFISNYVDLVERDAALKFEHKQRWNEIISSFKN